MPTINENDFNSRQEAFELLTDLHRNLRLGRVTVLDAEQSLRNTMCYFGSEDTFDTEWMNIDQYITHKNQEASSECLTVGEKIKTHINPSANSIFRSTVFTLLSWAFLTGAILGIAQLIK